MPGGSLTWPEWVFYFRVTWWHFGATAFWGLSCEIFKMLLTAAYSCACSLVENPRGRAVGRGSGLALGLLQAPAGAGAHSPPVALSEMQRGGRRYPGNPYLVVSHAFSTLCFSRSMIDQSGRSNIQMTGILQKQDGENGGEKIIKKITQNVSQNWSRQVCKSKDSTKSSTHQPEWIKTHTSSWNVGHKEKLLKASRV